MSPNDFSTLARTRPAVWAGAWRSIVFALVLALTWWFPTAVSADDPPILLSASPQEVKSGEKTTLHVRLHNVKDATLNGDKLKGNKINKKFTITADTTFTVAGKDKKGNPVSQSITVRVIAEAPAVTTPVAAPKANPQPDLWLVSLDFTSENAADPKQITYHITARVGNIGQVKSDGFVTELYNGAAPVGNINMDPLSPGTSWVFTWDVTVEKGKFYTFTATADPANRITEANEGNNSKELIISNLNLNARKLQQSPLIVKP